VMPPDFPEVSIERINMASSVSAFSEIPSEARDPYSNEEPMGRGFDLPNRFAFLRVIRC
jgi:hypothetical protein